MPEKSSLEFDIKEIKQSFSEQGQETMKAIESQDETTFQLSLI